MPKIKINLDVVKKNKTAVICAAVVLVSVVAVVWPVNGYYESIVANLAKSAETDKKLGDTYRLGKAAVLPIIDPRETKAAELGRFPTKDVYDKEKVVVDEIREKTTKMLIAALADNRRTVIEPDALPRIKGVGGIQFRKKYGDAWEVLADRISAKIPLRPVDITQRGNEIMQERAARVNLLAPPLRAAALQREKDDFAKNVAPGLIPAVIMERALSCAMYISNDDRERQQGLQYCAGIPKDATGSPDMPEIWWAQIGYWIQEDLVAAIAKTNGDSKTVPTSVVKRLVRTNIPPEYMNVATPGTQALQYAGLNLNTGAPRLPPPLVAAPAPPAGGVLRSYLATPTGRVCNSVYDVVHFTFTVDVDASKKEAFLANFSNQRSMTVLATAETALDLDALQQAGLYYGPGKVVQMNVTAEAVFFRDWTKDVMPVEVKQKLQFVDNP